jgi:hypothetical protein
VIVLFSPKAMKNCSVNELLIEVFFKINVSNDPEIFTNLYNASAVSALYKVSFEKSTNDILGEKAKL